MSDDGALGALLQDPALPELVSRYLAQAHEADARARYRRFKEQLEAPRFVVPIVGVQGAGKSTLLNALCFGEPVLPTDVDETTCVPIEVHWAAQPSREALVVFKDKHTERTPATEEGISALAHHGLNPGNQRDVERVIVESDSVLLQSGLVLVDLPGLGSLTKANTETTLRYLEEAVGAVFVLRTVPPITRSEALRISLEWQRLATAYFVQNRWTDERDEEAESGREHNLGVLRSTAKRTRAPFGEDVNILLVNGYRANEAALKQDAELTEQSGMGKFVRALREKTDRWPTVLRTNVVDAVRSDVGDVRRRICEDLAQLSKSKEELEAAMRAEEASFAFYISEANAQRAAADEKLSRFTAQRASKLLRWAEGARTELRNRMREKMRAGITDGPRLDRALVDEQSKLYDSLVEETRDASLELSDALAQQLGTLEPWSWRRDARTYTANRPEQRKWEAQAERVGGALGGSFGGMLALTAAGGAVGGPAGLAVGFAVGMAGWLFGSLVGRGVRKAVNDGRSRAAEDDVFKAIDRFVSGAQEDIQKQTDALLGQLRTDLDTWLSAQTAKFDARQAASRTSRDATAEQRRSQHEALTRDLARADDLSRKLIEVEP